VKGKEVTGLRSLTTGTGVTGVLGGGNSFLKEEMFLFQVVEQLVGKGVTREGKLTTQRGEKKGEPGTKSNNKKTNVDLE